MIYTIILMIFLGADSAPESYLWVWSADSCPWCAVQDNVLQKWFALKPMLDGHAIKYYKRDFEQNRELARKWKVNAFPTIFVVIKGKVVYTIDGRDRFIGLTNIDRIESTFAKYGKLTKSANR